MYDRRYRGWAAVSGTVKVSAVLCVPDRQVVTSSVGFVMVGPVSCSRTLQKGRCSKSLLLALFPGAGRHDNPLLEKR